MTLLPRTNGRAPWWSAVPSLAGREEKGRTQVPSGCLARASEKGTWMVRLANVYYRCVLLVAGMDVTV